jgi:TetR/AcrR family transcriptional regulator, copper-responsive repressor
MVQKSAPAGASAAPKRRGRPRAYDAETALQNAIEAFWQTGYSGTSLDDLSAATGMNRPSLYAAFGDKRSLYLKALDHYWTLGHEAMREALDYERPVAEGLMHVYRKALSLYFSGKGQPRGCFAIGTATTEAVEDAQIRAALAQGLAKLDDAFEARIRAAQKGGELRRKDDPAVLAMLASATLHTIAIRARAGTARAELEKLARKAVAAIWPGALGETRVGSRHARRSLRARLRPGGRLHPATRVGCSRWRAKVEAAEAVAIARRAF